MKVIIFLTLISQSFAQVKTIKLPRKNEEKIKSRASVFYGENGSENLKEQLKSKPDDTYLRYRYADALYLEKKLVQAQEYLQNFVSKKSDYQAKGLHLLGQVQFEMQKFDDALKSLQAAKNLNARYNSDELFHFWYGKINYMLGNEKQSLESFNTACSLTRKQRAHFMIAEFYYKQLELNLALNYYKEVLNIFPDSPVSLFKVGKIHFDFGRMKESSTNLKKFISLAKDKKGDYWEKSIAEAKSLINSSLKN